MKPFLPWLAAALIVSAMPSCKKDNAKNDVYNGPKLLKVMVWGTNQPSKYIEIYEYQYDDLSRVTRIDHSFGDSVNGDIKTNLFDTTIWYYKGNERLPYKYTGQVFLSTYPEKYFYYDNQGKLTKDSVIDPLCSCNYIKTYAWSGNTVMVTNHRPYGGGIQGRVTDSITISNNNQVSTFAVGIQSQTGRITGTFFTSDNKLNPLHTLNIQAANPFTTPSGFPTVGFSQNNITEATAGFYELLSPVPTSFVYSAPVVTYKYSYNEHNLPVSCESTGRLPDDMKIKYYYSN